MKRIKEFFLLKDDLFFDLLFKLAQCAHDCSKDFEILVRDYEKLDQKQKKERLNALARHEKYGDAIVRNISEDLYRHFITPIDREDIHELASNLDTSIDMMEEVGKKFFYYRIDATTPIMKRQAEIATAQIREIRNAMESLRSSKSIKGEYLKVFELEDEADEIYEKAMIELFDPGDQKLACDALRVIKLKDLYDEMEDLTDLNQKLAAIIEGVVIKHV